MVMQQHHEPRISKGFSASQETLAGYARALSSRPGTYCCAVSRWLRYLAPLVTLLPLPCWGLGWDARIKDRNRADTEPPKIEQKSGPNTSFAKGT